MTPSLPIKILRQWLGSSLANAFALRAALIAIACSLMVATISLGIVYWVERATLQEKLQEKSHRIAERVEGAISVLESAVTDLSKNPLLVTALLDSPGRISHVVPFLQNYRLPIAASSGLSLCDLNGEKLAGMRSELSECHASSPRFKQLIAEGTTQRELTVLDNGHLAWRLYQGVIFPYTGTVEGVVVSQLDLTDILLPLPKDLDVHNVVLQWADTFGILISAEMPGPQPTAMEAAKVTLFKGVPGKAPFPIEVVAKDHLSPVSDKLPPLLFGYGLGSLLLIVAVVFWAHRTTRKVVSPLRELSDVARKIAENGDLSIKIPRSGDDEVGQLASAFEVMVETLRRSEASLESKVALRTAELRKSEAAAEAANLAKSRFLATMSHEIRTPMNGILGMAQLLLMPDSTDSERQDYARTILTSGQTLLALLNDILDLSKIEAGKFQLETTVFAPEQLLRETQSLFAGSAKNQGLQLEFAWCGPAQQRYRSDAHRLRQMLTNLVGNAIKFTARGQVRIEAREVESDEQTAVLEFAVTDTGIGIAEDKQSLLFQPFSQADSSMTRQFGGTGLGLSIVHSLAKKMGGDVGVESTLGKGSRFWFRIHAEIVAGETDSRQTARAADEKTSSRHCGRVLVVEDNATNRKVVVALLDKLGVSTVAVGDGQQAVDAIVQGDAADLILMDLQMPVMDGYTATEHIRQWEAQNQRPRRPIVALTADAFEENRRRCLNIGMDDFIAKPIAVDALVEVLGKWLPAESVDVTRLLTAAPIDRPRIVALVNDILSLLGQNRFDAINRFKLLEESVAATGVAGEIAEARRLLEEFHFDLAGERLRHIAAAQGWENES